jgi:hypothetical protein
MSGLLHDPAYCRKRAEEARVQAEAMDDPVAKTAMLQIAESYEKLANRAKARELGLKPL